jgi:hypothetical protein
VFFDLCFKVFQSFDVPSVHAHVVILRESGVIVKWS